MLLQEGKLYRDGTSPHHQTKLPKQPMLTNSHRSRVLFFPLAYRGGVRLALLGFGIGMLVAAAVTRLIRSLLYGISASDPVAFVSVASLLICVVLLACFVPAWPAMRVDPMVALRHE